MNSVQRAGGRRPPTVHDEDEQAVTNRRIGGTLVATLSLQALGLVSGVLIARLLGVNGRGLLAAALLWPIIIVHLGDVGGPIATAFLAAREPTRASQLLGNALLLVALQGFVLAAATAVIVPISLHRYGPYVPYLVLAAVIFVPSNLLYRYVNWLNLGLRDYIGFNVARLALQVSYVAAITVAFVLHSDEVAWIVAAYALAHLAAAILALAWLLKRLKGRVSFSAELIREGFRYGIRAHLGNLTPIDMMQLDLAVVVLVLSQHDAGLYAIGISAGMIIRQYGSAFGLIALPHVASTASKVAKRAAAATIVRLTLVLTAVLAGILIVLANWIVPLVYGQGFGAAVPIVRILAVAMLVASLRQVLGDCLRGAGEPLSSTISEIVSWAVALISLLILVPRLGVTGAALAVLFSYGSALVVSLAFCSRLGLTPRLLLVPAKQDARLAKLIAIGTLAELIRVLRRRTLASDKSDLGDIAQQKLTDLRGESLF